MKIQEHQEWIFRITNLSRFNNGNPIPITNVLALKNFEQPFLYQFDGDGRVYTEDQMLRIINLTAFT